MSLFLKCPDIAIGQVYRAFTHIKRFYKAVDEPDAAQEERLLRIVRENADTAFGRAHKFDSIKSVADYRRYVPPAKYEDLQPYIDAARRGEKRQLTAEQPFMFATTSGTTASPKFIPITEGHLKDYTHAFQVHNYHMIKDFPHAAMGRFFIITSNDEEGHCESGAPYGAVSGLLNRRQSPIIRRHFAIPYELCKIKDVDAKYYLMLRVALAQDVTALLCCNPSSLLLLADQMREHSPDLIADLFDGTLRNKYAPPPEFRQAIEPYLRPARERARQLERICEKEGTLLPRTVWPRLAVLGCWKGGPMSFYLERLPEAYGEVAVRDFGYMASEGRGSIPLSDEGAGGVLALTSHFFEFVAEDDMDSPNPEFLVAGQLQKGQRYYIFFTTAAGLYRYNINDLVEVVDLFGKTPVIQFVRKGVGISSITGEKLTEEQVLVALTMAVRQLNLSELSHFTAEVALSNPPFYVCYAEFQGAAELPDSVRNQFLRIFDDSLKNQNPEYQDKRATRRLGAPALQILPAGTYTRLRQQRVMEGAPEAQVKIPLLSALSSFTGRLAGLTQHGGA